MYNSLQAPVLLLTMVYVAVFAYLKPYRSFYINVLEVFTLVDIMLQLIIASTQQLEVYAPASYRWAYV